MLGCKTFSGRFRTLPTVFLEDAVGKSSPSLSLSCWSEGTSDCDPPASGETGPASVVAVDDTDVDFLLLRDDFKGPPGP